jgi:tryptophanase
MPAEADFARERYLSTLAEPYRVKMVEKLRLPDRSEREAALARAHYSPVFLDSSDVFIDLVSDSGTAAMSDEQWSALMRGDEAYIRPRSFFRLEAAVQDLLGFQHMIPTHQGRAAERIMLELLVRPGDVVLGNTHSDTTRSHIVHRGGIPLDLVDNALFEGRQQPFLGNFDLAKLRAALERNRGRVSLVICTIVNNVAASAPVSLANLRAASELAAEHGVSFVFDACRFAENAYLIREREPGQAGRSVRAIAREMFALGSGCWMSAKKDALVNAGGFIAVRDEALARRCQELVVLYEGFFTYGGLAGRDLEAMAVGLYEGTEDEYLSHRTRLVAHLGERLATAGMAVVKPVGGSGVYVDPYSIYPQLDPARFPSIALFCDLYLEGGVRVAGIPAHLADVDAKSGETTKRRLELVRFAVPRRAYGKAHLDYVAEIAERVVSVAPKNRGYRVVAGMGEAGFLAQYAPLNS